MLKCPCGDLKLINAMMMKEARLDSTSLVLLGQEGEGGGEAGRKQEEPGRGVDTNRNTDHNVTPGQRHTVATH